jgi:hypothetical protein
MKICSGNNTNSPTAVKPKTKRKILTYIFIDSNLGRFLAWIIAESRLARDDNQSGPVCTRVDHQGTGARFVLSRGNQLWSDLHNQF